MSSGVGVSDDFVLEFRERFDLIVEERRSREIVPRIRDLQERITLSSIGACELGNDDAVNACVFPLGDDPTAWRLLDSAVVGGLSETANRKPWRRIVGVLQHLGAVSCVVEFDYVCLDYRSEFAAYYSQLHTPTPKGSARLHFFGCSIAEAEVFTLSDKQQEKYLGYVVLRPGDLPPVGRAVISLPNYVSIAASIDETVNFFGTILHVEGVPFMQQDERFDLCAHVTTWAAHYSAYRRGIVGRRLIAEFVSWAQSLHPMSPALAQGLFSGDVGSVLRGYQMRTLQLANEPDTGPRVDMLDARMSARCASIARDNSSAELRCSDSIRKFAEEFFKLATAWEQVNLGPNWENSEKSYKNKKTRESHNKLQKDWNAVEAIEYAAIFRPYLESRLPVIILTDDHAMLLCGIRIEDDGHPVFFFHDDQFGLSIVDRNLKGELFLSSASARC